MKLTRHLTPLGARWAADGRWLLATTTLDLLLAAPAAGLRALVAALATDKTADGPVLAPIEPAQEVWACGVTYLRSRDARMAESTQATVYDLVYAAERPEVFFKASGWRVAGPGAAVLIRGDSAWNVPEPELVLVVNAHGEIVGYTAGNDMSSRDIEGANPLYLPQAKIYDGACALGSSIVLSDAEAVRSVDVHMRVRRGPTVVFEGETNLGRMKRAPAELVRWLSKALAFPAGLFVMTGTGIVPPESFTLHPDDAVDIRVGDVELSNVVAVREVRVER